PWPDGFIESPCYDKSPLLALPFKLPMRRFPGITIMVLCLIVHGIFPASAIAAEETVRLDFVNADIDAAVKAVGEMTGRSFVVDPRVKGTINLVSGRPVPKSLAYPML